MSDQSLPSTVPVTEATSDTRWVNHPSRSHGGTSVICKSISTYLDQTLILRPSFFWIVCGTEIFQNSARTVYGVNLADIQERTRGTSTLAAGLNSAFQSVIQIVTVPLLGMFFDRYGWRMPFVSFGASLYVIVFILIGLTTVHPLIPIILSSFALAFNVLPFIGSIPILVNDESLMGTAYGIWSSFVCSSLFALLNYRLTFRSHVTISS